MPDGKNVLATSAERTGYSVHMITVLVRVTHGPEALAATLSALVPAVAAGLIGDAVILADKQDDILEQVADAAGATLVVAPGASWTEGREGRAARLAVVPRRRRHPAGGLDPRARPVRRALASPSAGWRGCGGRAAARSARS